MAALQFSAARRGRPRKFMRPSRPVTVTLPEDVIAALQNLDTDLSRAVVQIAQSHIAEQPHPPAELTNYGDRAVIIVRRNPELKARTGVELVPLSDGRALIAFDDRLSISQIELRVRDSLDDRELTGEDRAMFEALAQILRSARQSNRVILRQRSIIVLQWKKGPAEDLPAKQDGARSRQSRVGRTESE